MTISPARVEKLARLRASEEGDPDRPVPLEGGRLSAYWPAWKDYEEGAERFIEDLEAAK